MHISRVKISRQHLKKIKLTHIYDGVSKYKQPKSNCEIETHTIIVLYDIFRNFITEK